MSGLSPAASSGRFRRGGGARRASRQRRARRRANDIAGAWGQVKAKVSSLTSWDEAKALVAEVMCSNSNRYESAQLKPI